FNFVAWVRQKYHILKSNAGREYEMVEEAPYGSQAQADFGEYNLRNSQGRKVKVHFMTMVLSRSRYKWVFFSTSKFKTEGSIDGHERAFGFFEGVADTVVYDQDRVFLVDENKGDLVLTEKFRTYSRQCGFKLHFCRKADPESKGKIENVVKYVKQNFLYNRPFSDIETLNQEALAWLARTANHMPHSSTRKQPGAEWEIEKQYLKPYHPASPKTNEPLVYSVRKDNSNSIRGND
ncbi:MAG: IS21 family transposase, partial [Chitinophagales bacterium]